MSYNIISRFFFCTIILLSSTHAYALDEGTDKKNTAKKDKLEKTSSEKIAPATKQWPQEIKTSKGVVIIYQPQPESLKGDQLKARAAISVELNDADKPVFGAIWFDARLQVNRAERSATIADVKITNVRIPDAGDQNLSKLEKLMEREIPKWNMEISMSQLTATLKLEDQLHNSSKKINTAPPEIIFIEEPAILITIDGEPKLQDIPQRSLKRVVNTPYTLIFSPTEKLYYLNADKKVWYTTSDLNADWSITKEVPRAITDLEPKPSEKDIAEKSADEDQASKKSSDKKKADTTAATKKDAPPPKIIIRTKPAELISATGKAEFKPVDDVKDLLYMSNTESDVLLDISHQKYYVLLAGRWYNSDKMQGPWKYVAGKSLPAAFAKIPEKSHMGTVLYAVPGTEIAKEAVLNAQIPQTAAINRSLASLTVEYDGEPIFQPILSTALSYAVNTATPVIKVSQNLFYAVDNAVWFAATSPKGKWTIATSVPDEIYTIPADSPMYNITFVKIYKAEPEVVYVGYTPGYTNTYVYGSTIVYGTGYYYPGWYQHAYYPYPATYGYYARWNPYMGWGYGMSYSSGPFTFSIGYGGWYGGGWWGPHHYYGYRHAYYHGYRRGVYSGYRPGYRPINRPGKSPSIQPVKAQASRNLYKNRRNAARITPANKLAKARPATNRKNNVYADKQGNLHRKTNSGWQNRNNNDWQKPAQQRPANKAGSGYNRQQLQRSYQSRQQGAQRRQQFNRARAGGGRRR